MIHPDEYDTVVIVNTDVIASAILYTMDTPDNYRAHGQMAILMVAETNRTVAAFNMVELTDVEAYLDKHGYDWSITDNLEGFHRHGMEIFRDNLRLTITGMPNPVGTGINSIMVDAHDLITVTEKNIARKGHAPEWDVLRRSQEGLGDRYLTERFIERIAHEFTR